MNTPIGKHCSKLRREQMESSRDITMAHNFIANYGKKSFAELLNAFSEGVSNAAIAEKLSVTRQRVHQWKRAFTKKSIIIKPEIAHLL